MPQSIGCDVIKVKPTRRVKNNCRRHAVNSRMALAERILGCRVIVAMIHGRHNLRFAHDSRSGRCRMRLSILWKQTDRKRER